MQSTAIFLLAVLIPIVIGILIAMLLPFLPMILSGAEEKAHARRLADARMNARLLRFNL